MRTQRIGIWFVFLCLLQPLSAAAAITKTELAGNSLAQYPFFEYVRAFNVNAPIKVAIDPTRFPAISGDTCRIFVVNHKSPSDWTANPALVDVTPGGAQTETFAAANIQGNTFQVTTPSVLNANAGLGLGVGYDVVLDCDSNNVLSDGDIIDGLTGEAGLFVVHDTTLPGPEAVTEQVYNLTSAVASTFGFPDWKRGEDVYFPTNIAAMGKRPLVVIGRGNGHDFRWYDHIGNHLASYGYVVMSHDNDTEPASEFAAFTTLGHTDAFLDQAEAGAIAGGALVGHIDARRIVWIGHSRGGEGVAIAYDRLFDGTTTPTHYTRQDIRLVSSMLPTDFNSTDVANPHNANYHLWTASGDSDVNGGAGCDLCQTFHLHDRATGYRQSTVVQGTGHGWFHDEDAASDAFTGPCALDETITHQIQLGYLLPLVNHYIEGNIPALDFLTRQYESFHPIGVPVANPCVVVSNEYRNGFGVGNFVIDDYQTQPAAGTSSSGGTVTFNVENVTEDRLDDNNSDFVFSAADPFNGATQGGPSDTTRGVVFDWTGSDRFYEWQVPATANDFSKFLYLSFRGAQGTRHPNTIATLGDLTFSVTLRDSASVTSTIRIDAYGSGLSEPYQRSSGWHNEMETIRIRTTDFLNNASGLSLANIVAVRLNVGPTFGSNEGRIVIDDLMLTNDLTPLTLRILEPTTARPRFAGTSVAGSRVLVRLLGGGGLDLSPGNLTISVDGTPLTAAQIPTPAALVGGETWVVIAPGTKANGCYDLTVSLTTPAGVSAAEPQSLCWADDETRDFDRVLAIDQTNSMLRDGSTGLASPAKMEAALAAAKFFVDLSNPNDKIGVISFQRRDQDGNGTVVDPDELAEPIFSFVAAGEGITDQRPAARIAISGIAPDASPGFTGPETSPGAGLVEARTMLDAGAVAGHEPHIVLLTDGLENYAPFWSAAGAGGPLRPVFDADDIRVDTVGVGGDADDVLLEDIASVTGGQFINLNEGSGSFFLLSRLADWYKSVDEDVRGEQRFFYAEGFPPPNPGLRDKKIRIACFVGEPGLDWMTVAFHTDLDNAATVRLFAPSAAIPIVAAPPMITVRTDPKHSVYRIRQPQPGLWCYLVEPNNLSAEFFAVASAPTSLTARVGPKQLARRPSGDYAMPLRVWIADKFAVRGGSVSGYVRRPDGVKNFVTLSDNGLSTDGDASDGIYGLEYLATIPGAYYVRLKAAGTSNAGTPYERYLSTAFVLPGQPKRPIQPGEGLPTPPRGEGCKCEAETRYSLSFFGGATFPHGSFDTIADSSTSLGIRPAFHFPAWGGRASLGLYLGRDRFANPGAGSDFQLTHLSPELEFAPWRRFCPVPSLHFGAGAYRNENGDVEFGFNAGAGLAVCLNRRVSFLSRYDYRSVNAFSRDYSTIQIGLRFNF
ncbi:MAG TPA: choice-of-anchor X domain-containing protein [Thermoanaerobaculia bacterium]|nr:choice-of-anchor X domain-containing protein [Thermoanaerobaculia bacterium]